MKKNIILFIIVTVLFSTFSTSFAFSTKKEKLDISEETGVKGWIIKKNAENYCKKFDVKLLKMYNVKIIKKNEIRSNIGAVIKSYLVAAEVQVEKFGHYYTLFYVYTGEKLDGSGELYSVEGYFDLTKQGVGYRIFFKKTAGLVRRNAALNEASLRMMMW